jgi:fatty-acyl-CoA synthase
LFVGEWFPKQTLGALPGLARDRWGERDALVYGAERWTFAELSYEVDRVAKGLLASGVQAEDKVGVWMTNRPEWIFLMFAVAKVGATLVPLNTRYRSADVRYTIRHSDMSTLITLDRSGPVDYLTMLGEVIPQLASTSEARELSCKDFPELKRVIVVGAPEKKPACALGWQQLLASCDEVSDAELDKRADAVDPDGLLVIGYTSGTTGDPKGAMHTHAAIRNVTDCGNRLGVTFEDAILNYLPMFHLYAYSSCAMLSMLAGAKQVLMEAFDPLLCVELIERERCTLLHGFDTHYRDIMDAQKKLCRDLSSLRLATFPAGSDASRPVAERTQRELCPSVSGYGMTEVWTFSALSFPSSSAEQRIAASGFPSVGYEFKIVDPTTGEAVGPGRAGEILMRGYMITKGYYRQPEATAHAIDEHGWFHSGDTGMLRPDGHLQFIGRYKDMLKVGGENVSPAEVEGFLLEHPAVAQIAVVGAPDARLSEVAVAFVVAAPAYAPSARDLIDHCKGKIASFKIPKHVFFVEALPATPTGKVQKHLLRAKARELLNV